MHESSALWLPCSLSESIWIVLVSLVHEPPAQARDRASGD